MAISCHWLSTQLPQEETLTSFQLECSTIIRTLSSQATDPFTIVSLMGAGCIAKISQLYCLKWLSPIQRGFFSKTPIQQALSSITSAAMEGTFFHASSVLRQGPISLSDFGAGAIHSSLIIGGCKLAGGIAPQSF